jgi:DNA recombination-dependent growth factor C
MGLMQGTVSLRRFLALGPVPGDADLLNGLRQDRFRPFEGGDEEERFGWVDWRNPLITEIDPDCLTLDRFAVFSLRIDARKVPPILLKAHTELRIMNLKKEKDLARVGKEARISLQDEVKAELLRQVLPTPRVVEVAWDLKGGLLWTTASNSKTQDCLTSLFMKSFGIELRPLTPAELAARVSPNISFEALKALVPFDLDKGSE